MILSRGRAKTIQTNKLLPDWIEVLVPESEKSEYEAAISNPIITTPDNIEGLGMLRNWCLDNFPQETVIMIDDDINKFYCLTGEHARGVTGEEFVQVLINTAVMAKDAGAKCFGFSQVDIRKFDGYDPFWLCAWFGMIFGVIGRKFDFRNDKFKVDIDFVLQNLLVERIIWMDNRYYAINSKDNNTGGNSKFRSQAAYEKSVETLQEKWGDCIKVKKDKHNSQIGISLNFRRKQHITI